MELNPATLVIGASAAGLATAACLRRMGCSVEILEATTEIGAGWRAHYDRLHLHTPKANSALPGLRMPAWFPRYPARDQVVEYLELYRERHQLQPRYGQRVVRLERQRGSWVAHTEDRQWRADNVVIASGLARRPIRPTWPGMSDYSGKILHSSEFRNGARWSGKTVLVIGFGNSAGEQAIDLVESGATVHLSVRSAVNAVPRDLLGFLPIVQIGVLLRTLPPKVADVLGNPLIRTSIGDLRKLGLQPLPYGPNTQIARDRHIPLLDIGTLQHIRAGNIRVHGGVARFSPDGVVFDDGRALRVDAVVLGTGYRPALEEFLPEWRAVCDDQGMPTVSGRPTALPGLYFCGYQVSSGGMLREIGIEARRIAKHLATGQARVDPGEAQRGVSGADGADSGGIHRADSRAGS